MSNWSTRITDLLDIQYPIVQGGLAYLAYADLASAVSNAGGLGQITAMSLSSPNELKSEIRKTKSMTDKPFGVNFAIGRHGRPFEHMLEAAMEEGVQIVSVTGGNPTGFFKELEGVPVKKLVLVAAKRQALKAEELGADAVIVVGQEGGGHIGRDDTGTFVLTPTVVDALKIPVIASGGIADGRGYMAALSLGAEGIEMGTRFIVTKECMHASNSYIQAIINGTETDTEIIKRTLKAPGRVIGTPWSNKIIELEHAGAGFDDLKEYISGSANKRYIYDGKPEEGFGWAGQSIGLINDIMSVEELIKMIIKDAEKIRLKWSVK